MAMLLPPQLPIRPQAGEDGKAHPFELVETTFDLPVHWRRSKFHGMPCIDTFYGGVYVKVIRL